jgi:thiamine-phosphate pyrophosphorylase
MDQAAMRMLDANFNRAREALRTVEDYCRFVLNDAQLAGTYKTMRHELCGQLAAMGAHDALLSRDTPGDVGVNIKTSDEVSRTSLENIATAAAKRLTEALRVLEELSKLNSPAAAGLESLRYQSYTAEQRLMRQAAQRHRCPPVALHVLLTESLCRRPWCETLEAILTGGADVVQLREKNLTDRELLVRARFVAQQCRKFARLSIINDRVDIAMAAGASGVHLGQDDLPCQQARQIAGNALLIGVSTENLQQALSAAQAGASYIGAGPMFPTTTKSKPRLAGSTYMQALRDSGFSLSAVAIGGINKQNLPEVLAAGATAIAVSSAVLASDDPAGACRELRNLLTAASTGHESKNEEVLPKHGASHA